MFVLIIMDSGIVYSGIVYSVSKLTWPAKCSVNSSLRQMRVVLINYNTRSILADFEYFLCVENIFIIMHIIICVNKLDWFIIRAKTHI